MTKDSFRELIQNNLNFSAKESKDLLETLLDEMKNTLEQGDQIKISGFGRWSVREKKSRTGRNPNTNESMEISARRVVSFTPSRHLRQKITGKKI